MFVNTLVLRTEVEGAARFVDLLAGVREADLQAFGHADVPFERIVESLGIRRSSAYSPLFQVMLVFQNLGQTSFELPDLEVSALDGDFDLAQFDIQLSVVEDRAESGDLTGMTLRYAYATDLYDTASIELFAARFLRVLEEVTKNPAGSVRSLDITTEAERRALEPQRTVDDLPDLVAQVAAVRPDEVAIRHKDAQVTYGQLHAKLESTSATMGCLLYTSPSPRD